MGFAIYVASRLLMQFLWMLYDDSKRMAFRYFISHSNKLEDSNLVVEVVVPKLKEKGIYIYEQDDLQAGTQVLPSITSLVDKADKTLLFLTENALNSSWCSFEMLISLEKSQRTNRLAVVLLLHKIEESQLPHLAVLQETRKIYFDEGNVDWVRETDEALRETKTIGDIMPAGNVAHGLVWSHYAGFLQYILPVLEKTVQESAWYKSLPEEDRNKVSFKLYELVPKTCAVKYNIPNEDKNIKEVQTFKIMAVMRGGNHREISVTMYSITIGQETFYCMCEFPNVIGTMKVMEDNHLARFSHTYPGKVGKEAGFTTAAQFTTDDKKLQLGRFYYTMNSTLNHFEKCFNTARVLLYNDEKKDISEVLMEAVKEDLKDEISPEKKLKGGLFPPKIDKLESVEENVYAYEVFVACTDHPEDEKRANEIISYLTKNGIPDSDILHNEKLLGTYFADRLVTASKQCRWFIFLLTKHALKDESLNFNVLSALGDSIYNKKVRVIPVVDQCDDLHIPEALRWITYIPFDDQNKKHLKSLYSIVSGRDTPMETQMILPAGDVANGLAWGYVTNYLRKILPDILNEIIPAFEKKGTADFKCPHKLYIIIPKSCNAGNVVEDNNGRIVNFTKTGPIYPFGNNRSVISNIYKVSSSRFFRNKELYFVGQYAAPVTCLGEMKDWAIAGVNDDTIGLEAERFYGIVSQLMKNAAPDQAQYCEFIYFDDTTHSLADIMEEEINKQCTG